MRLPDRQCKSFKGPCRSRRWTAWQSSLSDGHLDSPAVAMILAGQLL